MVTLNDLYEEANRFLWDNYRLTLTIPIDIEDEYPEAEAWYEHTRTEPRRICIAQETMDFGDDEIIYDCLRHELVHHALHLLKKPFADGCDYFENELKRLGVGSTGSTMVGRYHIYQCDCCGDEIPHHVKLKEKEAAKMRTHCCEATFTYTNKQAVFDGKRRLY